MMVMMFNQLWTSESIEAFAKVFAEILAEPFV